MDIAKNLIWEFDEVFVQYTKLYEKERLCKNNILSFD